MINTISYTPYTNNIGFNGIFNRNKKPAEKAEKKELTPQQIAKKTLKVNLNSPNEIDDFGHDLNDAKIEDLKKASKIVKKTKGTKHPAGILLDGLIKVFEEWESNS